MVNGRGYSRYKHWRTGLWGAHDAMHKHGCDNAEPVSGVTFAGQNLRQTGINHHILMLVNSRRNIAPRGTYIHRLLFAYSNNYPNNRSPPSTPDFPAFCGDVITKATVVPNAVSLAGGEQRGAPEAYGEPLTSPVQGHTPLNSAPWRVPDEGHDIKLKSDNRAISLILLILSFLGLRCSSYF